MSAKMRVLTAVLASGALLALAACGGIGGGGSSSSSSGNGHGGSAGSGTSPSAASLESDAITALKTAQSVKLSGNVTTSGKTFKVDLGLFRSGSVSGSLSGPYSGNTDVSFDLIVTGGSAYILVDKQFFNSILKSSGLPSSACSVLCGKYIKTSAKNFSGFNLNGLVNQGFKSNVKVTPTVTSATIDGQPAYGLTDAQGDRLYVARNGTHYPIEITRPGSGALVFSDWNSVPPISAPPANEVVSVP